jgi:hypothetical protein
MRGRADQLHEAYSKRTCTYLRNSILSKHAIQFLQQLMFRFMLTFLEADGVYGSRQLRAVDRMERKARQCEKGVTFATSIDSNNPQPHQIDARSFAAFTMSSEISSTNLLAPYEIIFSCAICQTTITQLYRRPRTDHGFSSGGDQERVVTRLWLTECGHLTCSDHLEGGGTSCRQHMIVPTDLNRNAISPSRKTTECALSALCRGEERFHSKINVFHSWSPP